MRVGQFFLAFVMLMTVLNSAVINADSSKLGPNDIADMHQTGRDSDFIIGQIVRRGIDFEANSGVLVDLMNRGVPGSVIEVLIGRDTSRNMPQMRFSPDGPARPGVTIVTSPPGLSLLINNESQGVTPGFSNTLPPGKHLIKVEHPLFFTRQEEIDFDGKNSLQLRWKMEPREPVVRVNIGLDRAPGDEPWSWIIRPRNRCPGCEVTLQLKPWQTFAQTGEAMFVLDDDTKRHFRGTGTACLELNLWRGEVRRDLPMRRLPRPTMRYFITDIRINGIELIDMDIRINLKSVEHAIPDVSMQSNTGFLISEAEAPEMDRRSGQSAN